MYRLKTILAAFMVAAVTFASGARQAEARRPSARQPSRRSAQSGLRSWLAGKLLRTALLLDPAAHEAPRKAAANSGC